MRGKEGGVYRSFLSIVVPAFNEEKRLDKTLPQLWRSAGRRFASFEILVVDDGSTDGTGRIVREFADSHPEVSLLRYEKNRGKGYAVRTGVLAAKGEYVLFCDADLSTPFREIDKLMKALQGGCDIAIGSRARNESKILKRQPIYRVLMGKTFNKFVQVLALPGIIDSQCGFKCFRGAVAREIFECCRIDGFSFDVELLFVGRKKGMKIKEVGVLWENNALSKVHPVFHSLQMLRDLIFIRWYWLAGCYGARSGVRSKIEASSSR
jgi:dolichyl-phosphate beta-glucosyltransferase